MIINLTQHQATPAQQEAGVVDLKGQSLIDLKRALTFTSLPTRDVIEGRVYAIVPLALSWVEGWLEATMAEEIPKVSAMVGGAPFLMGPLVEALTAAEIEPLFAFSVRESIEVAQPDGSVAKKSVFSHVGFVSAWEKPTPRGEGGPMPLDQFRGHD